MVKNIQRTKGKKSTFQSFSHPDWFLPYIYIYIDIYIYIITYILYNQDLKELKAVPAALVDFERQNHHKLLTMPHDLDVPGSLLYVVNGFLDKRTLNVSFRWADSQSKDMLGGGPQVTIFLLFLLIYKEKSYIVLFHISQFDCFHSCPASL